MVKCSRCSEPCEWSEGLFVSVQLVGRRVSNKLRLCARCGEALRVWLETGEEGMPGAMKDQRRLSEDLAPSERIDLVNGSRASRLIEHLPKHPDVTESRQDSDGTAKGCNLCGKTDHFSPDCRSSFAERHAYRYEGTAEDGSSSPPVASTLPEEYRWSGLE